MPKAELSNATIADAIEKRLLEIIEVEKGPSTPGVCFSASSPENFRQQREELEELLNIYHGN